jgi:hypothetical protein
MTRWEDNRLELGTLGVLRVDQPRGGGLWWWEFLTSCYCYLPDGEKRWASPSAARRAAVSWLRRALQQASKRVEG